MNLAPIVLFTYNRPWHTQQVLNSLAQNAEAKDSVLYIYCDGPKENANETIQQKIQETRAIVKAEKRFKQILIVEQLVNKGLANSIIEGVTTVVNKHNTVIVLEDDLIVSKFFLQYMNDSLQRYELNTTVAQIGACNFFACGPKYPTSFFISMSECLGWATWKNRWQHFNPDASNLLHQLHEKKLIHKFNAYGSYDMEGMLEAQIQGKVSSWAIRWQAVCILNNWLTLYPNPAYTNHVESNEATHANKNILPPLCNLPQKFITIDTKEVPIVIEAMKRGYSNTGDYYGNLKAKSLKQTIKKIVLTIIPKFILQKIKNNVT